MMSGDGGETGAEAVRLAPVIPLFGSRGSTPSERHPAHGHGLRARGEESAPRPSLRAVNPVEPVAPLWRAEAVSAGSDRAGSDRAGLDRIGPDLTGPDVTHPDLTDPDITDPDGLDPTERIDPAERIEAAERVLLRRLRAKALSVSEARLVLRGEGLDGEQSEEVIDDCLRRGYLDDRVLAELLVRAGVERRSQGRAVLARSLAQRGIDRALIDEALAELPDDDAERALEYARGKARSMARLDPDTALRRLVGQLARRGFAGSLAMKAAKQALREASGGSSSGVRFRDVE